MCLRRAPEKYIAGAALDRAAVDGCPDRHLNPAPPELSGARSSFVVEALCYKPEGRGFET
jgi:hypothetical protein